MVAKLAARVGREACLLAYQRVPEYPFPAVLHDAEAAYQALLDLGYALAAIVVGGESAGAAVAGGDPNGWAVLFSVTYGYDVFRL